MSLNTQYFILKFGSSFFDFAKNFSSSISFPFPSTTSSFFFSIRWNASPRDSCTFPFSSSFPYLLWLYSSLAASLFSVVTRSFVNIAFILIDVMVCLFVVVFKKLSTLIYLPYCK